MTTLNVGGLSWSSEHTELSWQNLSWKQTLQVGQNTKWRRQNLTTWVRSSSNNCPLKQCSASLIINLEQNPISTWRKWQFMQSSRSLLLIVSAFPAEVIKLLIRWAVWSESSDQTVKAQRRMTPACIRLQAKFSLSSSHFRLAHSLYTLWCSAPNQQATPLLMGYRHVKWNAN